LSFGRQSLTTPQAVLESPQRVLEQFSDSSASPQNSSKLLRIPKESLGVLEDLWASVMSSNLLPSRYAKKFRVARILYMH